MALTIKIKKREPHVIGICTCIIPLSAAVVSQVRYSEIILSNDMSIPPSTIYPPNRPLSTAYSIPVVFCSCIHAGASSSITHDDDDKLNRLDRLDLAIATFSITPLFSHTFCFPFSKLSRPTQ